MIFNLYSKRQTDAAKSGKADVYQYTEIPPNLRVQIQQIVIDALGRFGKYDNLVIGTDRQNDSWVEVERIFLREKGLNCIGKDNFAGARVLAFMHECHTADWLDCLELIALFIELIGADDKAYVRHEWQVSTTARDSIEEINYRLREAAVGYRIEDGRIFRVDSQFVHAEVVKPVLSLLSGQGFEGPQNEFLSAHRHYRAGQYREAVAMAANALESTFKAIFDKKGWTHQGARISDLVKVARENRLWPDYLDASFDQLVATLQSGLPKIRDNDASHGQGSKKKDVPAYIAAYALHLAASKIVFIVEAAK